MPDHRDPPPPPRPRPEPGAGVFAWGVTAAMLAIATAFVLRHGPSVPRWDDFDLLPRLTGREPITAGWLWSQHNEHRIPLPRLVGLAAFAASGRDFRAGMVLNVAALGVASIATMIAAAAARGHRRASDALYPLAFLGLGHAENLIWSFQIMFTLTTSMSAAVLAMMAASPGRPGPGRSLAIGATLSMLPLCGAAGMALAPFPAFWLLGQAWGLRREGGPGWKRATLAATVAGLAPLVVMGLYLIGYHREASHSAAPGPGAVVRTALQFLATSVGPAGIRTLPWSGITVAGLLTLASLFTAIAACRAGRQPRDTGLLAFLAGFGLLVAGTAWGRAGAGELGGAQLRYVTLAALAIPAIALAFEVRGPSAARGFVPTALFFALAVMAWPNTEAGLEIGREASAQSASFFRDVREGRPIHQLARRHSPFLHPSTESLADGLAWLREARIPGFEGITADPPFAAIAVPLSASSARMVDWDGRTANATGVDPYLTFDLPRPSQYVAGVRLDYDHHNDAGEPARFKLAWRRSDQPGFPADQEVTLWSLPTGRDRSLTVWIAEAVDQVRIQPDNRPCTFTINAFSILTPR